MSAIMWIAVGVTMMVFAGADLMNTLIAPTTSMRRWWPTMIIGRSTFGLVRWVAGRLPPESRVREAILLVYAPSLLLVLLTTWVLMEIVGFGMIFWGLGHNEAIEHLGDAIYYSGIVFFTVGFGDIVPLTPITRIITFTEALFGVGTVALVIGYLPAIYGAYSDREQALMSLDAGTSDQITPTELVLAWAPDADPERLNEVFDRWEKWAARVMETHTTAPLLIYMRSANPKQNWVSALGLLSDAAMHAQVIVGASDGASFWFLRRAEAILTTLAKGYDVSDSAQTPRVGSDTDDTSITDLYNQLVAHGFEVYPFETAKNYVERTRAEWAPQLDFLTDYLLAPKGFWSVPSTVERIGAGKNTGPAGKNTSPAGNDTGPAGDNNDAASR